MPLRSYNRLPPISAGYPLESNGRSWFSVIVPIARTNLITNPSFETNTTSWTNVGGTIARSAAQQYHGAYSLAVTPSAGQLDGASYDIALTSGTTYAYSAKVRGAAGVKYQLAIYTTGGTQLVKRSFTGTGRWQWIWLYYTETSSTTRRLYVIKDTNVSTATFYVDGVQVEAIAAGETVSTYLDGSMVTDTPNQFPTAYGWNGTPHGSTSFRTVRARNGGMVKPLSLYGFILLLIAGLGTAPVNLVGVDYALLDGGQHIFTRKPSRAFTLVGRLQGRTMAELDRKRGDLAAVLDRDGDVAGLSAPLNLLYQQFDQADRATSDVARVVAHYVSGLGGAVDNHFAEPAPLSFTMYLPAIMSDAEAGAAPTVQQNVSNANRIVQRSSSGVWSALSTGASSTVRAVQYDAAGVLFAGGDFTSIGASGADFIASWNGTAWANLGGDTALNGAVQVLSLSPANLLYVGGSFTNAGANANADYIATWNGSAWGNLSTGADNTVYALAVAPDGTLYAGGNFLNIGGVAANRVAKWNGSAWSAMGTGMNNSVIGLAVAPNGTVYAVGSFTTAGGATAKYIAKWNGSAWSAVGDGTATGSSLNTVAIGLDGSVYAGGGISVLSGVNASNIARWNGSAWSPLGSGTDTTVWKIAVAPNGLVWVGGSFSTAGGITTPDSLAIWNGSIWTYADINLPGAPSILALNIRADGTVTLGYDTSGTAVAAGTTTITNTGSLKAYPTLVVKGPSSGTSRIFSLTNYTTGVQILFNLTINAGETATFAFQPDVLGFASDFQGNLMPTVLPGSDVSDFALAPGTNSISFYADNSTVTAAMSWQPAYAHLSELTYS